MSGISSATNNSTVVRAASKEKTHPEFLRALGVSAVNWFEVYFTSAAVADAFSANTPLGRSVTQSVCTRSHP
jgi:hypothetical protein